jgi:hypothetical protein
MVSVWEKIAKQSHTVSRWRYLFMPLLLTVPPVTAYMVSVLLSPIFITRYLLPCLIPFAILSAFGIERITYVWIKTGTLVLIIVLSVMSMSVYYFNREPRFLHGFQYVINENWREATQDILTQAKPGDAVLFYAYFVHVPFEYYLSHSSVTRPFRSPFLIDLASSPYTIGGVQPEPNVQLLSHLSAHYPRIWLVLSHNSSHQLYRDVQTREIKTYLTSEYVQHNDIYYDGITVELYSSPKPTE